jgi:glycosyltransferase involved in cell wall biosynthesis
MIVPSTLMQALLLSYGVERPTHVIPTGLDQSRFEGGNGYRFRTGSGIGPDRPLLCHVGRSAHEKNIDFLLDMLVLVRDRVPDILLVLAGEGPAREHLEQRSLALGLDDNVKFVDYLDRDTDLKDCYRAGDVFVFASRTETQGLVLLEAMALGVPVVSTAILGTVDILKPCKGALVAEEDLEDFSGKVLTLLLDSELRRSKSREAIHYALEWSAEEMSGRLLDFYRDVLQSRELVSPAAAQASDHV